MCTIWWRASAGASDGAAAPLLSTRSQLAPRSVRFNKIEKGLKRLDGANAIYIRLNNVAANGGVLCALLSLSLRRWVCVCPQRPLRG